MIFSLISSDVAMLLRLKTVGSTLELVDEERWFLKLGKKQRVEMLCYPAARCRWYLHTKSLGDGGEYLS
jgi:hypothetical protein